MPLDCQILYNRLFPHPGCPYLDITDSNYQENNNKTKQNPFRSPCIGSESLYTYSLSTFETKEQSQSSEECRDNTERSTM